MNNAFHPLGHLAGLWPARQLPAWQFFGVAFAFLLALVGSAAAQEQTNYTIHVPGKPFGVAVSPDQQWIFASLLGPEQGGSPGIVVLQKKAGRPEIIRTIPLTNAPAGIVVTHDGSLLIAAAGDTVLFFDTARLESGASDAAFQWVSDGPHAGSFYVNVSADDQALFVSDEDAQTITVIDLARLRALGSDAAANLKSFNTPGYVSPAIVGKIPVGLAPIALTFSPDQRWLFTTSEVAPPAWGWPAVLKREGGRPGQVPEGALIVVDAVKARTDPPNSVVSRIPAGGSPVRLSLSPRDHRLYLTARNSNALLVFDTDQVLTNAAHVVPVKIPVGTSPVPVVNVLDGKLVLVGNSDRFNPQTASSTLTVVDTSRIGTAQNPIIGSIPSGAFPRNFQLTPDGKTLYLSNFLSGTIQVLDVARLASYLSP